MEWTECGVRSAERQELQRPCVGDAGGFFFEDADEAVADELALALRVGHALEIGQKRFGCVDRLQPDVHVALEGVDDLLSFALTQQPVVHEQAG